MKVFIIYDSTPFAGYIRFSGTVNETAVPDGSTMLERIDQILIKYPTTQSALLDISVGVPDNQSVKYDSTTQSLIPLAPTDKTPDMLAAEAQAEKAQDFIANLPSWSQVQTAISNIGNMAEAKQFLLKLSRVVYWLAKNSKD